MIKKRWIYLLVPALLAVTPILSLYASNIGETVINTVFYAVGLAVLLMLGLMGFLWFWFRDLEKVSVLTSINLFYFFAYGHLFDLLSKYILAPFMYKSNIHSMNQFYMYKLAVHFVLISFWIFLFVAFLKWLKKNSFASHAIKIFLMVSLSVGSVSLFTILKYNLFALEQEEISASSDLAGASLNSIKRDVYFIILDGYGREDILKEHYQFDNSDFLNFLRDRGFYVDEQSYSNYSWTSLSLAATLNMEYLDAVFKKIDVKSNDLRIPYALIDNHRVGRVFQSMGYEYVHMCSTWNATTRNSIADKHICYENKAVRNEFLRELLNTTFLMIQEALFTESLAEVHLYNFQKLSEVPLWPEPTFTLAHFILPHHPYLFDRNGRVNKHITEWNQFQYRQWQEKEAYLEQLVFLNKKIKKLVIDLIEKSEMKPIIIIQSDHGIQDKDLSGIDYVRARTANLSAIYIPDESYRKWPDRVTPINTFRNLFSEYYHLPYPPLKDRTFYSEYKTPFLIREFSRELLRP